MGNEVANRAGTAAAFQVPAHLAAMITPEDRNITERFTVPSLTFGGKSWTMNVNGEKKILQRRNEEGDMENVQILRVIILDYAKVRERGFYETPFDAANPRAPDCWSQDGRKPHADVPEPQGKSCETCAMAAKGSKQNPDGSAGIACQQHRSVIVIPAADLAFPSLRLRFSVTSDWDKKDEEAMAQGWFGFNNYTDMLRANGVVNTSMLITRMRFDPKVNYPKIQFARGDFLDQAQFTTTLARSKSDEVKSLLSSTWTSPADSTAPRGRPLPQEGPAEWSKVPSDPVFSQSGAAAQAAQEQENARLKAIEEEAAQIVARSEEAARAVERINAAAELRAQEATQKAAAEAKATKAAELRRQLAEMEADAAGGFDEPAPVVIALAAAPAPVKDAAPPKRSIKKAAEPAPPTQIPELPTTSAMDDILAIWDKASATT